MNYTDLKNGAHVVMGDDCPCKIVDVATSKTGKHGSAKKSVTGIDVISGKKHVETFNGSSQIQAPEISRTIYQLCDLDEENYMDLLHESGDMITGIKLQDDEVGKTVRDYFDNSKNVNVTVLMAKVGDKTNHKVVECRLDK